jgi:hypothetical protein
MRAVLEKVGLDDSGLLPIEDRRLEPTCAALAQGAALAAAALAREDVSQHRAHYEMAGDLGVLIPARAQHTAAISTPTHKPKATTASVPQWSPSMGRSGALANAQCPRSVRVFHDTCGHPLSPEDYLNSANE